MRVLGNGFTFIHRRYKVKVVGITRHGVRVIRVNQPGYTFEIPFSQLPKEFR